MSLISLAIMELTPSRKDSTHDQKSSGDSKPLWICSFMVQKPRLMFCLTFGSHLLVILINGILQLSGYDIVPYDFSQVPLNLEDDVTKLRTDAWWYVREDARITLDPTALGGAKERRIEYGFIELVYNFPTGNIFTRENLKHIEETERTLTNSTAYENELCLLLKNGHCKTVLSIIRFFDGSYVGYNSGFYDPDYRNITGILSLAYSHNITRSILVYHLHKGAEITEKKAESSITRSLIYLGQPLKGFDSISDRPKDQLSKQELLLVENLGETLKQLYRNGIGEMHFYYYTRSLFFYEAQNQVIYDLLLVGGSFAFIFLFMWFQTRSLWITGWGLFSIISCFCGANLIYRVILDYRYIGIFHVLSVFIILGIGADDIFVFYDTWRSTEAKNYSDLSVRLSVVYKRAASAMFITSFTTMVAFLTSASSPLLAVSSFGVFSALLVLVNYLSVISFFPAVVINYELYWKDWAWPCSRCMSRVSPVQEIHVRTVKQNSIVRFFEGPYFKHVVNNKIARIVLMFLYAVLLAVCIYYATKLHPDEKQVDIWGPGTNWYTVKRLRESEFMPSQKDDIIQVTMIWGLKLQDRRSCHLTDYLCKGQTVLDDSFDMNPPPCQISMLNFCNKLLNLDSKKIADLRIRINMVTGKPDIMCFISEMEEFYKVEGNKSSKYPAGTDLTLPITAAKMETIIKYNPTVFNSTNISNVYYRYFEAALSFWMSQGGQSIDNEVFVKYGQLIGGAKDPSDHGKPSIMGSGYGNRLLFAGVKIDTTMKSASLGYLEGLPVYNEWETFMNSEMNDMPPSCKNGYQGAVDVRSPWHWLKVQKSWL